jgi:hypothetical protein
MMILHSFFDFQFPFHVCLKQDVRKGITDKACPVVRWWLKDHYAGMRAGSPDPGVFGFFSFLPERFRLFNRPN